MAVEKTPFHCTVNDDLERFDISMDESERIRKKEEEISRPLTLVSVCEQNELQVVYAKMENPVGTVIDGPARTISMIDVKLAERDENLSGEARPFHIPTIKKAQEEYVSFERSETGQRFMHPQVINKNISSIIRSKYKYLSTEDVASLSLKKSSLQSESNITCLSTVAAEFASCSTSVGEESLVEEYNSDDSVEIIPLHPHITFMVMPRRSLILDMLSPELRLRLKSEVTTTITTECAKLILGERFKLFLETKPISFLRLSDSLGHMFIFWITRGVPRDFLLPINQSNMFRAALGHIRDQKMHNLCWAYVIADLISVSRVLHGYDEVFTPLCTRFLCQNVMAERFERTLGDEDKGHQCYSCELEIGLLYVKMHGIPKEISGQEVFDCNLNRPSVKDEERFYIKDIYKYHTLEQALFRLKSHPVAATLLIFEGWSDKCAIYRGPLKRGAKYISSHGVVIVDCKKVDGEMVAVCRSSNGTDIGYDGYIYVSLEVMVICVGAVRRKSKASSKFCHIEPQHLLRDFYSVDMTMGPNPSIKHENPKEALRNRIFKVCET